MNKITLPGLLECFSVKELAEALFQANVSQAGMKTERIERLCSLQKASHELLDLFTAEALRIVCDLMQVQPGRKSEMITRLVSLLEQTPLVAAIPEGTFIPPTRLNITPTKDAVIDHLKILKIPRAKVRDESDAEYCIGNHLFQVFENVAPQYSIGGYLALKIDIDIGNGKVGVEVKLVDSLIKSAGEIHRLIGQAIYYQKKRYMGNLIVAVVGRSEDLEVPMLKEMYSFLESFGIPCVRIQTT